MPWTIIVATSDAAQLELLVQGAQEIAKQIKSPGGSTLIMEATSVDEVERKRQRRHDGASQLLVVAASLPNVQSSPNPEAQPGLDLIKSVAQEAEPPACILVSDQLEHYDVAQGIERCEWLAVNSCTNYVKQCLQLARKLGVISFDPGCRPRDDARADQSAPGTIPSVPSPSIADSPVPKPPASSFQPSAGSPQPEGNGTYALLEVGLPSKAYATVSLEIHKPEGVVKYPSKMLYLNQMEVDELITDSRDLKGKLADAPDWQADYRKLGYRVNKLFWPTQFSFYYGMAHGQANGNVRLRFNLERSLFDGLWEAIVDSFEGRFLMLDNTITRRADQIELPELFVKDTDSIGINRRDLNVLVIRSDVPDRAVAERPYDPLWQDYWTRDFPKGLDYLPHLNEEVEVLRALRGVRKGTRNDGTPYPRVKVDVIEPPKREDSRQWSLAELVQDQLKKRSRRYDIVHFAGHALFDDKPQYGDGRGYLVFSGHPNPRAVTIAEVATWLEASGVQLVYLSCCRSGAAPAALELARNKVPMTIGFSWNLDDEKAVDFAKFFYDALLENDLKVCHAMCKARRKLYNEYDAGDPIWASPVLVAQPMDWIQVEGVVRPQFPARRPSPRQPPRPPRPRSPAPGSPAPSAAQPSVPLHS